MATVKRIKVEGLRELEAALSELPKATQRNVLKRVMKPAADSVDDAATANAPERTGELDRSIIVGTRLTRRQRTGAVRQSDGSFRSSAKNYVELHIGTADPRGLFTEFGTFKDAAQLWFTRAWEGTRLQALEGIKLRLGGVIDQAAARLARKRAKL